MRQRKVDKYWAIVDRLTNKPVLFDGRLPLYWSRSVARDEVGERGFTMYGSQSDVKLQRVTIRPVK